jgi:hypothetical protein
MRIIVFLLIITTAHAEPLPQPRPPGPGGSCPYRYFSSGSFCVPSQGAQDAVPNGVQHNLLLPPTCLPQFWPHPEVILHSLKGELK